jgi:hypothetical protein
MHLDRLTEARVVPVTLEVVRTTGKKGAASTGGTPAPPGTPAPSAHAGATPAPPRLRQEDHWFIPDLEGWRAIVARVPELTLAATLGAFNVDVPFEHSAAWRLILVLRRTSQGDAGA